MVSLRENPQYRFMIEAVHIQNFRTLTDTLLRGLGGLNIFVGPNSAGKSSLVEALGIFFDGLRGDSKGNAKGVSSYLWHIDRDRENIRIAILLSLISSANEKEIKRIGILQEIDSNDEKCKIEGIQLIPVETDVNLFNSSLITSFSDEALELIQSLEVSSVFHPVVAGRGPNIQVEDFRRISFFGPGMIDLFRYIRGSRILYEKLRERFTRVFPGNELSINRSGQEVEIDNLPAIHWGGGHQSVAAILALLSLEGHIFAIEEPEQHLHPGAIERLSDILIDAANDSQILVGTHSQYILNQPIADSTWLVGLGRDDSNRLRTFCVPVEKAILMTEIRNRLEIPPIAGLLRGALIVLPEELRDVVNEVELDIGRHARTNPQQLVLHTIEREDLQTLSNILESTAHCRVYVIYKDDNSPWTGICKGLPSLSIEETCGINWLQVTPSDPKLKNLDKFVMFYPWKY